MIKVSSKGNFSKTINHLRNLQKLLKNGTLEKYGQMGVEALKAATPASTGKTASSWSYKIQNKGSGVEIQWHNSNINKGVNIAVLIQYGHGTRNGGYVKGIDYINPAMKPIFEKISKELEREVNNV